MAYRLTSRESVRHGIRRVSIAEIESAIERLTQGKDRDEAIHDARKSVKKVRGALRLVIFDLAKRFKEENATFREIGRKLSQLRDSAAMIEIFDDLVARYADGLGDHNLTSVRRGLESRKKQFEAAQDREAVVNEVVEHLRAARLRVDGWPLHSNGFAAIAPGLTTTFKAGRKAFATAYGHANAAPEDFHEWRKRAKDHWYHVRLLENLWTPVMEAYESELKDLEQKLGDDHNLTVLRQTILEDAGHFPNKQDLQTLSNLVDTYQDELRLEARNVGERVYGQKPREFQSLIKHLWEAWKHEAQRTWSRTTPPAPVRSALARPA